MNELEKMIMKEISTLNEMRLIDVLGFIRYLKMGKTKNHEWIEGWFEDVLNAIRKHEGGFHTTPEEVQKGIDRMRGNE